MTRAKTRWSGVLLAAAPAAAALGGGSEQQSAGAAEPRLTTVNLMVPAPAFAPQDYGTGFFFDFSGSFLEVGDGGFSYYEAPVSFPVPVVNIKKVTLYAYDNDGTYDICASLRRVAPAGGDTTVLMGGVCTAGGNTTRPQVLSTTAVSPRQVNTAGQGLVLVVTMGPGTRLYGVRVTYSY